MSFFKQAIGSAVAAGLGLGLAMVAFSQAPPPIRVPAAPPDAAGAPDAPAPPDAVLPSGPAPAVTVPTRRAPSRPVPSGPQTGRLKFDNTPIDMVLQDYGETTGLTLLYAPGLPKANVVLRSNSELSQQEYLAAIEAVLGMHGIALLREGDKFVRVVPNKTARQEPMPIVVALPGEPLPETDEMVSQMIPLRHIEVADAQKIVDAIRHPYGTVQLFERNNSLLVTDTSATINRILEIIQFADQPAESRDEPNIIQIRFAKAEDVKRKLEEIIAESQEEKKRSAIARPRDSGQPGVERTAAAVSATPGVIRARPVVPSAAGAEAAADVIEAAERGIIRGAVRIVADDRTNILLIITRPENMAFFEKIIQVLDVETAPEVVVRVYRLEFADAKTTAGMLNDMIGATAAKDDVRTPAAGAAAAEGAASAALRDYVQRRQEAAGQASTGPSRVGELSKDTVKILADERTNALVIMASSSDMLTLELIIKDMDMMLSQVLIEAVILEIGLDDKVSSGVDWVQRSMVGFSGDSSKGDASVAFAGGGGGGQGTPSGALNFTSTDSLSGMGSGLTYYLTFFDLNVDAVIKMAASDSRSRVMSTPIILTTDNTEAHITSTEKIYVLDSVTQRSTTEGGDYQNYSKQDVGLDLKVKPRINANRFVMLEVEQTLSEPNPNAVSDVNSLAGTTIYKERKIEAKVVVKSGQTVVLGGAVREQNQEDASRIPILGNIPLLGRLFSYKSNQQKRTETVVFLTPFVLDSQSEIEAETRRRKNSLSEGGIWKQGGWSGSTLGDPPDIEPKPDAAMRDLEPVAAPGDAPRPGG